MLICVLIKFLCLPRRLWSTYYLTLTSLKVWIAKNDSESHNYLDYFFSYQKLQGVMSIKSIFFSFLFFKITQHVIIKAQVQRSRTMNDCDTQWEPRLSYFDQWKDAVWWWEGQILFQRELNLIKWCEDENLVEIESQMNETLLQTSEFASKLSIV